jgi:hypothetical protein
MSQTMLMNGLFGTGNGPGGVFGNLLQGFMGGGAVPNTGTWQHFAHGTNSAPGGLAVVGENGPEIVNLRRGAQVIPNDVLRQGGGGGVEINLINQAPGVGVERRERNEGGRPIIDMVIAETKRRMARGEFDDPMRGRYGARPSKTR